MVLDNHALRSLEVNAKYMDRCVRSYPGRCVCVKDFARKDDAVLLYWRSEILRGCCRRTGVEFRLLRAFLRGCRRTRRDSKQAAGMFLDIYSGVELVTISGMRTPR